jgi:hypothetical protein
VLFLQKKDGPAWHWVQVQTDFLHIVSIPRETRVFLRLLYRRAWTTAPSKPQNMCWKDCKSLRETRERIST